MEQLNEKHIEEQLQHANVAATTLKYLSKYRKQKKELVSWNNLQRYRNSLFEKLIIKVIMDCTTATTVEFRTKLGFNQYY